MAGAEGMIERAIHAFTVRERPTFVSGPLSASTYQEQCDNVRRAMLVANYLIRAGHVVICPHLFHYLDHEPNGGFGWQFWIDYDLKLLAGAGRVVRIPGESPGASIEVDAAIGQGIRVYFWDDAEDWGELMRMYKQAEPAEPMPGWAGSPY